MRAHLAIFAAFLVAGAAAASGAPDNYQLTLWNEHNGQFKDRGTRTYRVEAFEKGGSVWKSDDLKLEWSATEDPKATVDIPPQALGIDQIKIYIIRWIGSGGGLSEVTLSRNGVDITDKCKVTVSDTYERDSRFSEKRLVDKVTSSEVFGAGYWLLPNDKPGYVTIMLTAP